MDCLICNAKNPEGAKYCGNCGSRLDVSTGPIKEVVEAAVRQEVGRVLERNLKDQKIAEFDITENVTNRLLGWAKILGTVIGVLLVLAGILGVKSGYDIKKELQVILRDIRQQTKTVKDEIAADAEALGKLKSEDAGLQREYDKLRSALPEYEQIRDRAKVLDASIDQIHSALADQASAINAVQGQVQKLVMPESVPLGPGRPPYRLRVDMVIPSAIAAAIQKSGKLVFQITGNTGGVKDPAFQMQVANQMAKQCANEDLSERPAFLYILGNIVYYAGEASEYYAQFYKPYQNYPAPIFAIPGNHDGTRGAADAVPSLAAFRSNFCTYGQPLHRTPESADIARTAMVQPNCYWTLDTPGKAPFELEVLRTAGGSD